MPSIRFDFETHAIPTCQSFVFIAEWRLCTPLEHVLLYGLRVLVGMLSPTARIPSGKMLQLLAGSATSYYHFSAYDVFSRWVANSCLAFGAATLQYLLVERPMMTITTKLLKGGGGRKKHGGRPK